ncbi:dihydrofolate synthase/folylpolyglutamate synthase [Saccharopolyspora erythraea NRRL 2338]|uniref:Dihydrofolate synthase/folylpolyglutamate synthase n=2 Tax=Saccharopolyspora erythraea TaxID=1836 RepID=A4F9I4_SACEN|nr:folylpolyglutamate synthase/dihydrofolate synthase family protein [Saccharopolyspora erythraea]EQD87351.1 dihydrofolate synthase [Saccharopolyspora erythraea D]PFG94496.1 dihydrofolate synthase/folylpolyglutamate synthase [Saccharopolyspora erythraea NRRL 2338]QRK91250.1 bifunctional folylpolyglutamate synthase/dihydrofolate synthase [Saccharopolyspora erythraea]CAM00709.1 folylpolyglutamate synthase [Saccharopolyspora erythraea NRRL 2338]
MSDTDPGALQELRVVEAELNERWPETKIEPSLDRIRALTDLLAEPQHSYPVVHVAGTNGKSSTSRMIDALLGRIGLRVGRYTSPHLQLATERISIDGGPISPAAYVEAYRDVAPYVSIVDSRSDVPMSKFEVLTGMAFAAFADAPVEAAVLEVGMGGSWDATNVADARIAVICPVAMDHAEFLGNDLGGIATEKAGIIKPGSVVVMAAQQAEAQKPIMDRIAEVDATVAREGHEFGVLSRTVAVGGQMLRLQGLGGVYDEIFLPLHGEHQARNAALALAAVEAFFGAGAQHQLDVEAVRDAFAGVITPGRLERVRAAPSVLVDAAHNPHGARALAEALSSEFSFRRLVAVVGVLGDKDVRGVLAELEPVVEEVVLTRNSSPRAMDPDELASIAKDIFGPDRIVVEPRLDDAVETAIQMAEETTDPSESVSGGGVVITGSVVTAGEARALFGKEPA